MWGIYCELLSVPQNIVMYLNNVMKGMRGKAFSFIYICYKITYPSYLHSLSLLELPQMRSCAAPSKDASIQLQNTETK